MRHSRLAKIMMLMGGGSSASPLLTDLLSYWKMDETTGDRVDSHGSNDLSVVGTVGYAVGKLGNAVTCTGTANYLTKNPATVNVNPAGFTVWGWIQLAADARTYVIAGPNGANTRWYLGYFGSNAWRFYVYDSSLASDSISAITQAPTLNAWYFLCGRYNPTTKKAELRLNASAWALGAALGTGPTTDSNNLKVAGNNASGNCNIDSVGIANRYYSDAEVDELYNSGNGLEYPF